MTTIAPPRPEATEPEQDPPGLHDGGRRRGVAGDHLFRWIAFGAGVMVLVILGLIAYSTTNKALPWFRHEGLDAIFSDNWSPSEGHFGALALIYGTFLVGAIALVLAAPVSIGIALFVNEIAPRRFAKPITYTVDLLAAIPSVVYGLFVIFALTPDPLAGIFADISSATEGIPVLGSLFANPSATGASYMTAGIVVAIMITPIITSITREVFATTPTPLKEAAYGLGSTRWEMIRGAIFPHSRGGVVAAVMIGFGRAVGETIAVALVIGASPRLSEEIFGPGDTMASAIVLEFNESTGVHRSALIGLGVALLVLTLAVGIVTRAVVARFDRRSGAVA